jgi:prevent-host-death family protein
MRTITALEVRAKFGQVLDQAAAGERFIVERAGQPVAAIVPLRDLEALDPARERERRHAALEDIRQMRAAWGITPMTTEEIVASIRAARDERDQRILDAATGR